MSVISDKLSTSGFMLTLSGLSQLILNIMYFGSVSCAKKMCAAEPTLELAYKQRQNDSNLIVLTI